MTRLNKKLISCMLSLGIVVSSVLPIFAEEITSEAVNTEITVNSGEPAEEKEYFLIYGEPVVLPLPEETADATEETGESEGGDSGETPNETTEGSEADGEPEEPTPVYSYEIDGLGTVESVTRKTLGAGVTYYNYHTDTNGLKQAAFIAEGDPKRGVSLLGITVGKRFGKVGKISALRDDPTAENRLVAAVNADYFSMQTGVPLGLFINEGRFVSSSDGHYALGFREDGEIVMGKVGDSISFVHDDTVYAINYLNKYPTVYGPYLLTRDYGEDTRLASDITATEYIIALEDDIILGKSVKGDVIEVRTSTGNAAIPEGCAVLVVPEIFEHSALYKVLEVGEEIEIKTSVNEEFEGMYNAIGGGDVLLIDGEVTDTLSDESNEIGRNPRTAMGITADGRFILIVVDGRQSGYASGIKATDFANTVKALGCVDAIYFDGGGSSIFVTYSADGSSIMNKPSAGSERSVPNALAMYENREVASKLHTLSASCEELILSGAKAPITLGVSDSKGEVKEFEFTEKNTQFSCDPLFGSVAFADGVPTFVANSADGVGRIDVKVDFEGETLTTELFLAVTTTVDSLTLDQNILLSDGSAREYVTVSAKKGESEIWFGDRITVLSDNQNIGVSLEGREIALAPAAVFEAEENAEISADSSDENTEKAAVAEKGSVKVVVAGKSVDIPFYFYSDLVLNLGETVAPFASLDKADYVVEYSADGGIGNVGSFTITNKPVEPEVTTGEEGEATGEPEETTSGSETEAEETTAESETEAVETTEEVTETEETAEPTETTEPSETTGETGEPSETDGEADTEEDVFEPFDISLSIDGAIYSKGLCKRRIWVWADGLNENSQPYADIETASGIRTVYYERFYDFLDYNGRALLTLSLDEFDEVISIKTLFAYTAYEEEQNVTLTVPVIAEMLDTNQYADTTEHWSSYYVNALSYMGIVSGSENLKGELVYNPDGGLTREQFAKILVNYLKIDVESYAETEIDFADIDTIAQWAIPYVRAAVGAGLMKGRSTPQETIVFAPTDGITRQEAIYVLGGLIEVESGAELSFTDSDKVAEWAKANLSAALAAGLISGYDDGTLRPGGGITRAEVATIVVRLYEFSSKSSAES